MKYSLWAAAHACSCLNSVDFIQESLQPKRQTAHVRAKQFQIQYRNWTLVSVPDTKTRLWLSTTLSELLRTSSCLDFVNYMKESLQPKRLFSLDCCTCQKLFRFCALYEREPATKKVNCPWLGNKKFQLGDRYRTLVSIPNTKIGLWSHTNVDFSQLLFLGCRALAVVQALCTAVKKVNSPSLGQKSFSSNTDIGPWCQFPIPNPGYSHTLI